MVGWKLLAALGVICCAAAARAQSEFQVTADVISRDFVGFGAEMNPYLYATPNNAEPMTQFPFAVALNPYRQGLLGFGDVTERNVVDLEAKVIALHPQHVRIFLLLDWWSLKGDEEIAKGDPRMVSSLLRTVRLAQRAGASVNLTLWYGKYLKTEPERTGRAFAKVVADLILNHGLTAIQYLTIQNEVNGEGEFGAMRLTKDQYHRLYRALDEGLRRSGIRNQIKIIAGDLLFPNQTVWLFDMANYLSDVCDGYSIHVYWDYWNTRKLLWRLGGVEAIAASLPATGRRPMYITEFGVRGFTVDDKDDPGYFWDDRPVAETPVGALECGWFMLEAINRGFVSAVQWELYDVWYDRRMHYGLIGEPANNWKLKPGYHLMKLFTQSTRPGWESVKVRGKKPGIVVAAMRSQAGGAQSVFVMNHTEESCEIAISGFPSAAGIRAAIWNRDGKGNLSWEAGPYPSAAGRITVNLPPLSLTALTTSTTLE